jgi:hypothetical protein
MDNGKMWMGGTVLWFKLLLEKYYVGILICLFECVLGVDEVRGPSFSNFWSTLLHWSIPLVGGNVIITFYTARYVIINAMRVINIAVENCINLTEIRYSRYCSESGINIHWKPLNEKKKDLYQSPPHMLYLVPSNSSDVLRLLIFLLYGIVTVLLITLEEMTSALFRFVCCGFLYHFCRIRLFSGMSYVFIRVQNDISCMVIKTKSSFSFLQSL